MSSEVEAVTRYHQDVAELKKNSRKTSRRNFPAAKRNEDSKGTSGREKKTSVFCCNCEIVITSIDVVNNNMRQTIDVLSIADIMRA
ncbi:unnamed protein product [Clavelina lepadiformis]|uniref:Uncharacterized protein n=1 Tax=Clavelina lepadiformis TaxID=159417 RepID=A0ABP0FM30_CLALP